jgi:hypothetical protein
MELRQDTIIWIQTFTLPTDGNKFYMSFFFIYNFETGSTLREGGGAACTSVTLIKPQRATTTDLLFGLKVLHSLSICACSLWKVLLACGVTTACN